MRKYFEQLRISLLDFVEQREDLMMVVACPPSEAALMLKLLFDHQNNTNHDIYYLVANDFETVGDYVSKICERIQREYHASVESATMDVPPLPTPPAQSAPNSTCDDVEKMLACLNYARELVSPATGHRIVWCFSPEKISDVDLYKHFWKNLVPNKVIEKWMRGSRLIVRVPEEFQADDPLCRSKRVCFRHFVIPSDAAEVELRENIADPVLPKAERYQALLQLAFIDLAHGRTTVAKTSLLSTLAYHQQQGDPALQALAMIGLGDTCRKEDDFEMAKYWYECAIQPAGEGKQILCLAMIAQHLGNISYDRSQFEDAIFYFDQLTLLKRAIPDENGLVEALLWRARSAQQLAHYDLAKSSCEEALLLCKSFALGHREQECLDELRNSVVASVGIGNAELLCSEWRSVEPLKES